MAASAREAAVLLEVAEGHNRNEEDEDALIAAQDALKLFRSAKDHAKMADSLRIIIQCYASQGRTEEATSLAKEELASFKKAKQKAEEGKLLLSLSEVCAKQVKTSAEALGYAKEALALFRELRDEKMEAKVWLQTAKILIKATKKEGENPLKDAGQAANDALSIFQKQSDQSGKEGQAAALLMSAEVKAAAGDIDDAVDTAEEALDILQDIKQPKLEAFMLNSIATMCIANGRPYKALYFAQDALDIIRDLGGSKRKEVAALDSVVQALVAKGMTSRAVSVARDGLERFQNAGETRAEADTHRVLYTAYLANGDVEQAMLTMDKALEAAQDAGDKAVETGLLCEAADISLKSGNSERAVELANRALDIGKEARNWASANSALQQLVNGYVAQGDNKQAVDAAKELQEMLESAGDSAKEEATCCLTLSQAHCAAENFDLASAAAKAATEIAYKEDDESLEASALDQLSLVYVGSGKFEKAAHAAENARRLWKELDDMPHECNSLDQAGKAFIQQAYKKQASGKSGSAVSAIFEKATKAANDCIGLAKELAASENADAFMGNANCTLSQVHAAMGESEDAYETAKAASDFFWKSGDEGSGAYASALMAQASVQQESWDKAQKDANSALKAFKKFKNESGAAFADKILDTIQRLKPKPAPVQQQMPPQWQQQQWQQQQQGGQQQGMDQQQMMMMMQQQQGGGGGGGEAGMLNLTTLDTMNVTEDAVMAKIKEVALAIIGDMDGEEIEADTPLMEAGLTSSTAVVMRDEVLAVIPGVKISPTVMFDYPSVNAMTEMLMEQLQK